MFNQVESLKVISDEQYKKLKVLKPDIKKSEQDLVNIMIGLRKLICVCGDDPTRDGLEETPFRVLKAYLEYTEGYREDPRKHLEKEFDVDGHQELVIVKDIEFNSLCEHHFAPFHGRVHIGYIPKKRLQDYRNLGVWLTVILNDFKFKSD